MGEFTWRKGDTRGASTGAFWGREGAAVGGGQGSREHDRFEIEEESQTSITRLKPSSVTQIYEIGRGQGDHSGERLSKASDRPAHRRAAAAPPRRCRQWLKIADALDAAHAKGIVTSRHQARANIMLTPREP